MALTFTVDAQKQHEVTCMKKSIATAALLMLLTYNAHAADADVGVALKLLCTSKVVPNPNDDDSKDAAKIYEIMNESEKTGCAEREDDYVNFLIEKYEPRLMD